MLKQMLAGATVALSQMAGPVDVQDSQLIRVLIQGCK